MRKDTHHDAEQRVADTDDEGDDDALGWPNNYPHETITEAVPVDDVTAGVDVTVYDFDEADMPPMFEISENFPSEDEVDEESAVYFHGPHAATQVIAAISQLLSERFDEYPWDESEGESA